MSCEPPFSHIRGPKNATIALVGEAWGEQEERCGLPFMGASGQELWRMLQEADINPGSCFMTNVLNLRPPGNDLKALCVQKSGLPAGYPWPSFSSGKYLPPELLPEVVRLHEELEAVRPNLVIALGGTAAWALLRNPKISQIRGVTAEAFALPGQKVLPTYHPSAVLRDWSSRPVVMQDLMKASREAQFPEIHRPTRTVLVSPTFDEIVAWGEQPAEMYSIDTETAQRQITCVGFSRTREDSLVIPFWDPTKPGGSYWPTPGDEARAWRLVEWLCTKPIPKLFQNGLYDLQYFVRRGIKPTRVMEDLMLLHHSLFPELQKGLGFLGSIYTSEASWKLMVRKRQEDVTKKDE